MLFRSDPNLADFVWLAEKGLSQLRIVKSVGCEKFAELCFEKMNELLTNDSQTLSNRPINPTARILSVEVREHDGNSAIYERDSVCE